MKHLLISILSLFLVQSCVAQKSELPAEMPEDTAFSFTENGGMARAYKRISIKNGVLEFEELKMSQKNPNKWTADVSREDLAKLYKVFVENKFDTVKNDEREGIVYDAGSERISISAGKTKKFGTSYGKNSPLSGKNLERYQSVRRAFMDLIAKYQNQKSDV